MKADDEINSADVVSKKNAAVKWCNAASDAFQKSCKKCWKYLLIPHSEINNNLDFSGAKVIFLQK